MTQNVQRVIELKARRAELIRRIDGHKSGTAGDELLAELEEVDAALVEAADTIGLADVRERVRADLVAVAFVPVDEELEVHDLAALVGAYRDLGGALELAPAPPPARFNPADVELREKVRGAAWQAANSAGVGSSVADGIAARVAEALEEAAH